MYLFTDLDACATCSGEQDGSGVIVDNDQDNDGVCDADEIEVVQILKHGIMIQHQPQIQIMVYVFILQT